MAGTTKKAPKAFKSVYPGAEPILINKRIIGELYRTQYGIGYLCYATDNGAAGYYDNEWVVAERDCKSDHREHIRNLKSKIRKLTQELKELM